MTESDASTMPPDDAPAHGPLWRQKLAASAVHLVLSGIAVLTLLLVATQFWYPDFLFATDGGWQGLRIVVLVDLVLGPALTAVVFRRGKQGLVQDLTLIGALQIAAFGLGTWTMWEGRTVAIVFSDDRFLAVSASDFDEIGEVPPPGEALPGERPHWAAIRLPDDRTEAGRIRAERLREQRPLYLATEYYADLEEKKDAVLRAGHPLDLIEEGGESGVHAWLDDRGRAFEEFAFVYFTSRYTAGFVIIERATFDIMGLLPLAPGYRFIGRPIVIGGSGDSA